MVLQPVLNTEIKSGQFLRQQNYPLPTTDDIKFRKVNRNSRKTVRQSID